MGRIRGNTDPNASAVGRPAAAQRSSPGEPQIHPRASTEQVWRAIGKRSFAIVSHVTPSGEPRSSGVTYKVFGHRLYTVVGTNSWKAKHISANRVVAVTVPVRRGGLLSLVAPIPPATISFHGTAVVRPWDSPEVRAMVDQMASMLPKERRTSSTVVEIVPEGSFVTYGLGVSLMRMANPTAARGRTPVSPEQR